VGTNAGLSRLDPGSGTFAHYRHDPADPKSLGTDRVRAILEDRSGSFWIGTRGAGLARFDRRSGRFAHFRHRPGDPRSLSDDSVSCLFQDSFGTLWVGTYNGGLNRFDPRTGSFDSYRANAQDPKALSNDYVEAIYEDRAQNLWIGTRGGGVNRLDLKPAKFRNHAKAAPRERGLPHPTVRSLAASGDGALWIATDGGGLVRYDRARGEFRQFRHRRDDATSLSDDRVWSVVVDRRGVVWAGTYEHGLNRLASRGESFRFTHYRRDPGKAAGLGSDRVQAMLEDREGRLWLGTPEGLYEALLSASGEVSAFRAHRHDPRDATSLSHDYVSVIHQDRSGSLWLGTRGGLNRFDPKSGRFTAFRHRPGDRESLSNDGVYDVQEDERRDGVFWVATEGGGLDRLDSRTGRFEHMAIGGLASSSVVAGILQDGEGQLWLGTGTGLGRFDPERGVLRAYGGPDGLRNHSFVRNSALETADGEMYFGGGAGMTSFVPGLVRDNPHVPAVVLTSVKVFGEETLGADDLAGLDEIELSHRDNFVSIEFAALDFTAPGENEYAHRLDGIDADWVHVGNRNFASYTNLDPGRYAFRVKAANNDGRWSEQEAVIRLVVTPAYWQTAWFRIAAALILAAGVVVAHRLRVEAIAERNQELQKINAALSREVEERRRAESHSERLIGELEKRNSEMERFVYTVSHDLKSPVVTIKGFLGLAQGGLAKGDAEGARRDLGRVDAAADRMHRVLNELLDLSRVSRVIGPATEIDLGELAAEAIAQVAGPIAARGVIVDVEPDLPAVLGDRARLLEVLQNLIENAVKFMGEQAQPRVRIAALRQGEGALVSVEDNGRGVEARYVEKIFELFERLDTGTEGTGIGLALVKRIVEQHRGRVWVESEGPGRGSRFRFTLPLASAGADATLRASRRAASRRASDRRPG
jgi:signal transduction histidine kinase/ligand-binding sensor domain-containing protein